MRSTRRKFIRQTALGAASPWFATRALGDSKVASEAIPTHQPQWVKGVHAYADKESILAGEKIRFAVSADAPYSAAIYRLGSAIDSMEGDSLAAEVPVGNPSLQPIHPGSYIAVDGRILEAPWALTLECWLRPWSLDRMQGLITQEDKESDEGFALGLGKEGYIGFFVGNGVGPDEVEIHRTATHAVRRGEWSHLVASWDGRYKRIWVNGALAGEWPFAGPFKPGRHPFRIGAMGQKGLTLRLLDGDLAMGVVYTRAVGSDEVGRRFSLRGLTPAQGEGVWGCWDFHEEKGERVADVSGNKRHGRIINHATWMIGGPSFNADISRFGTSNAQASASGSRGHGLRFGSDDLYDCRWRESFLWEAPSDARAGVYVARLRYQREGREMFCHVPFVVRRRQGKRPTMLVLCATNTWRAYNAAPFGLWPNSLHADIGTDGLPNAAGDPPAFSYYRHHAAGQGTYQIGRQMPWPAGSPYAFYGIESGYSHLLRAERFLHVWLDEVGYDYDLATDLDLHRDPSMVNRYRCVVINGHSEYWSIQARAGLDRFLARGGNLVVLSGNTMFWRVSHSEDGQIMECRKVDAPGMQMDSRHRGECWHSHDGLRGGLMRDCGYPGWKVTGLESLGWNNSHDPKNFGSYRVTDGNHPLLSSPEESALRAGEVFGIDAKTGKTLANGHEMDVRLSTLARLQEAPNPDGGVVPSDPPGMTVLGEGSIPWPAGGSAFDYFFREIHPKEPQGGEMIYWERPEGGRVFNAGSIGSGWALYHDSRFQKLIRNVLSRFGVTANGV